MQLLNFTIIGNNVNGYGCAAVKLYLQKHVVGWIWPSSNSLPRPDLSDKNFASYLGFRATSFRESDHNIPFSPPPMNIRESYALLIVEITVTL